MSHISSIAAVCPCCGQAIKAKRASKPTAMAFRDSDAFLPAYSVACDRARAAHGAAWSINPDARVAARVPAAWVRIKVYNRTIAGRRDLNLPAAQFWPGGELPTGAEPAAVDTRTAADRDAAYFARVESEIELLSLMGRHGTAAELRANLAAERAMAAVDAPAPELLAA